MQSWVEEMQERRRDNSMDEKAISCYSYQWYTLSIRRILWVYRSARIEIQMAPNSIDTDIWRNLGDLDHWAEIVGLAIRCYRGFVRRKQENIQSVTNWRKTIWVYGQNPSYNFVRDEFGHGDCWQIGLSCVGLAWGHGWSVRWAKIYL